MWPSAPGNNEICYVNVFLQKTDGTLDAADIYPVSTVSSKAYYMDIGDVDSDGLNDVVTIDQAGKNLRCSPRTAAPAPSTTPQLYHRQVRQRRGHRQLRQQHPRERGGVLHRLAVVRLSYLSKLRQCHGQCILGNTTERSLPYTEFWDDTYNYKYSNVLKTSMSPGDWGHQRRRPR